MSTETATTPPTVIEREEQEERKYNLLRPTSAPIVLPNAGCRRFSDVYSQETWERWAR